jgi:endonuclease/exonuclease/phosphatase family metal-dependent hydrolase
LTAHLDLLEKGRQIQCKKIIDYIHKNINEEEHLILAGDFNDWREKLSKRYWNEGKLQEVFLQQFNKHARTFPSIAPTLRLDRIYFRNLTTQKALCFSGEPWNKISDHSPLYAEFSF